MATTEKLPQPGALTGIPAAQRHRIISGMRWTVWLSVLGAPFGYATTVLLARTSPEAMGTYGLLMVYIGVVQGLFYLGGDAVAIKFSPELSSETRLSFLVSYFLITCLAILPWIMVASFWPAGLQYIFGRQSGPRFQLVLIFLAPVMILGSLVAATLKGMLEIRWAQILSRLVTITFFSVYAVLFAISRPILTRSYTEIIFGLYLALCFTGAVLGLGVLWRLNGWRRNWSSVRFLLPRGFWPYTLSLQQGSALTFFASRLDVILLLNLAGLAVMGKYVAVITLAGSIRVISSYFTDTLLPSLTNMIAARNLGGAASAFHTHMRILFVVSAAGSCGLILLARPIAALLGAKYIGLAPLIILVALLIGICTPGGVGGTLLSSVGKQQRTVYVSLGQIAVYLALFAFLWREYHLIGAVLAYGIAWVVSNCILLVVARMSSPFPFSVTRDYVAFAVVTVLSAIVAGWKSFSIESGLLVWIVALGIFLVSARYTIHECWDLIHCVLPTRGR